MALCYHLCVVNNVETSCRKRHELLVALNEWIHLDCTWPLHTVSRRQCALRSTYWSSY